MESMEIVGHHGCSRWGLTRSLGSFMRHKSETKMRKTCVLSSIDGLVLLYTETMEGSPMYHVGNPLLQQWTIIPFPPHLSAFDVARLKVKPNSFNDSGLVTKMEKGIVLSYKVVWTLIPFMICSKLTFMIYSSETGEYWKTKENVRCLPSMIWSGLAYPLPLKGTLHWLVSRGNTRDADYIVCYDLYNVAGSEVDGGGDECQIVPLPNVGTRFFKRTFTTSAGFVVYCNVFAEAIIRVWRLVSKDNHPNSWKLSWRVNTDSLNGFGADYFPIVMHPFNSDIIYLWSRDNDGLVLLNLRTLEFSIHKEEEEKEENKKSMDGCMVSFRGCKEYMDLIYPSFVVNGHSREFHKLYFSQYVLPLWLNPLPSPHSSS